MLNPVIKHLINNHSFKYQKLLLQQNTEIMNVKNKTII